MFLRFYLLGGDTFCYTLVAFAKTLRSSGKPPDSCGFFAECFKESIAILAGIWEYLDVPGVCYPEKPGVLIGGR